jgi:CRP-like cAMP-binding protein
MYTANAGDSFAEASLFSDTYHCNAIATKDSLVHFYPRQKILEDLRSHPEKTEQLIALLASQVRTLRTKLEIRNILSARERILQFFYLSAHPDTGEIFLDISLKNLAEELGLAHETLYREMAKLDKEGIIKRKNNKVVLRK